MCSWLLSRQGGAHGRVFGRMPPLSVRRRTRSWIGSACATRPSALAAILAYGDLKRIELAIALAGAPKLLLMDEPTAGMAPRERVALMALAASSRSDEGIAVLFTEHDMDVVFAHADRIIVLDRGSIDRRRHARRRSGRSRPCAPSISARGLRSGVS